MNKEDYLKNNGVDLDKSLEYLGDLDMYNETLNEFLNLIDSKVKELTDYKNNNDIANYAILAHSIKSDARYLGFTSLAEIALNHEMQGKSNNADFINLDFDNFKNEIEKYVSIAKNYVGNSEVKVAEKPSETSTKDQAILVVDDSDIIRNFIFKVFNDTFDVIMAEDGNEAIRILNEDNVNKIKGVFLDLNMPKVSGFEVLDYFKNNNWFNRYPVSIITGNDDKESIARAFTYPIIDMLSKPFNEKDVKRIVERTVSFKR